MFDVVEQGSVLLTVFGSLENRKIESFAADEHRRPSFMAILTQATNPKAWIVSLSAITIYVGPYLDYTPRYLVFSYIFYYLCCIVDSLVIFRSTNCKIYW